jgi:hypothetical protein
VSGKDSMSSIAGSEVSTSSSNESDIDGDIEIVRSVDTGTDDSPTGYVSLQVCWFNFTFCHVRIMPEKPIHLTTRNTLQVSYTYLQYHRISENNLHNILEFLQSDRLKVF